MVAVTAKRHVHFSASNHRLYVLASCAEGEARAILAQLTNGSQLLNLLALGNQAQNVREGASMERALER